MEIILLLCDWAEVLNGKLYMMGAGWTRVSAGQPVIVGVAILIRVPWGLANQKHHLTFEIATEDGAPFVQETSGGRLPVRIDGDFEVGRPTGVTPGSMLDLPVAFKAGPLVLPAGRYVGQLFIDGSLEKSVAFEALGQMQAPQGGRP